MATAQYRYTRVSSAKQEIGGDSLYNQSEACHVYAAARGYEVVAEEARTSLVIASQRLEEYLTAFQMEQGRRGLRIPRPGSAGKSRARSSETPDWTTT